MLPYLGLEIEQETEIAIEGTRVLADESPLAGTKMGRKKLKRMEK